MRQDQSPFDELVDVLAKSAVGELERMETAGLFRQPAGTVRASAEVQRAYYGKVRNDAEAWRAIIARYGEKAAIDFAKHFERRWEER